MLDVLQIVYLHNFNKKKKVSEKSSVSKNHRFYLCYFVANIVDILARLLLMHLGRSNTDEKYGF